MVHAPNVGRRPAIAAPERHLRDVAAADGTDERHVVYDIAWE